MTGSRHSTIKKPHLWLWFDLLPKQIQAHLLQQAMMEEDKEIPLQELAACPYCADFQVVWTIWWFWQLNFWNFFIQINSEVKVNGHCETWNVYMYQISTNMELNVNISPATLG